MDSKAIVGGATPALLGALRAALSPALSPRRFRKLLDGGGRVEELSRPAAARLARLCALPRGEARRLARALARADPVRELEAASRAGLRVHAYPGVAYPAALRTLHDPPPLVYVKGAVQASDGSAVAVVGSRRASEYGLRVARALAADLASAGVTVVAGLARGIDRAAHEGALEGGGRTLAVLGSGFSDPYPPENVELLERVAASGAVLSEFAMATPPHPRNFPRRNRLIAALSLAVVVVEAAERSGALHTARHALDLGREVLAVPGPVDAPTSRGTLRLLQEGAAPVGSAQDVFAALGWTPKRGAHLPPDERGVLDALSQGPATAAELSPRVGLREETAAALLVSLEIGGLVARGTDGRYART